MVLISALLLLRSLPDHRRAGLALGVLVVAAYVVADKLFAYLGPTIRGIHVYPGELALILGVLLLIPYDTPLPRWRVARIWVISLIAWGTLILLLRWGSGSVLDSLRDFAFIYYFGFALFGFIVPWERTASSAMSAIASVFALQFLYSVLAILALIPPSIFGSYGSLLARQDVEGATLVGGAAFFLLADERLRLRRTARITMAAAELLLAVLTGSRAVLLAAVVIVVAILLSKRGHIARRAVPLLVAVVLLGILGGVLTRNVNNEARGRVTLTTAVQRFVATFGRSSAGGYATANEAVGSASWRLTWWRKLLQQNMERRDWLWVGRGFGGNLATEAGLHLTPRFQTLRSPHSIFVDVLARLGLVGAVLYVGFLLSTATRSIRLIRDHNELGSTAAWMLAYWVALLVVSLLGVVMESPFGAAPFYFLTGALFRLCAVSAEGNTFKASAHRTSQTKGYSLAVDVPRSGARFSRRPIGRRPPDS